LIIFNSREIVTTREFAPDRCSTIFRPTAPVLPATQ